MEAPEGWPRVHAELLCQVLPRPIERVQGVGLTPGSVSPFGLINDSARAVRVVLDRDLKPTARVSLHPNINTRTYVVSTSDFMRFLAACGYTIQYVSV